MSRCSVQDMKVFGTFAVPELPSNHSDLVVRLDGQLPLEQCALPPSHPKTCSDQQRLPEQMLLKSTSPAACLRPALTG